jgi:hypothetical protein
MPKPISDDKIDMLFPNLKLKRFSLFLIKRKIKFFVQRCVRGWDDSQTWNLDYELAKFIAPRLKRFRELNVCHPMEMTSEEWDSTIDKMIFAFEKLSDDDYKWSYDNNQEEIHKKVEEGRDLFHKYYYNLWW